MFSLAKKLTGIGTLGINERNSNYTLRYNPRHLYPLVDDKLLTKQLAKDAGIGVPRLYATIEIQRQVADSNELLKPYSEFVVKPAHGSGGDGILVFTSRSKDMYRKTSGLLITQEQLNHHISNILSGMYSLGGHPDKALVEYRVKLDPVFGGVSGHDVPDIRIIVFLGIPVMSMVRLPTQLSEGKANLHQGAVGVGIDMRTGATLTGVWCNDVINEHPDTGNTVTGLTIPGWDSLLRLAARCYELTGLGYQGVDIVLDRDQGPLLLEINARPGLNIQIANRAGLLPRLKLVEQRHTTPSTIEERILFAKEHFGA